MVKAKKKTKKPSNNSKAAKSRAAVKPDWPQKRNLFFRPERMKYVRKLIKNDGCVFCIASEAELSFESLCVYKSKHSQIILNKYPYNNGHLLVLPLAHVGDLLTLSPERYEDLHNTLRLAVQAVQSVYEPNGFNIGMNHGATSGAGIPDHLHYHIVPRWNGDLNFFPLIAETKVVIESLEQSYQKFSDYFKKVKVG